MPDIIYPDGFKTSKIKQSSQTQSSQTPKSNPLKNWDFSPLEDVKSQDYSLALSIKLTAIVMVIIAALIVSPGPPGPLIYFIIITGLLGGYLSWRRADKANQTRLAAYSVFAARNRLTFKPKPEYSWRVGSLFRHGHSRELTNYFSGQLNSWDFECFNYIYITSYGRYAQNHKATVIEIELPRILPHIILDSQVEGQGSSLPIDVSSNQRIKLEGDFDKYIHLYAPKDYQITALSILTPDVMETLLKIKKYCDIEIIGNKLYFYWIGGVVSLRDYQEVFLTTEQVLNKIGKKLVHGDVFASEIQAQVHTSAKNGSSGVRLINKSGIWLTILGLGLYIITRVMITRVMEMSYYNESINTGILFGGAIFVYGALGYIALKQYRLKKDLKERLK